MTDRDYLRIAYRKAWIGSGDPSTKNGAVIVSGDFEMTGWNEFPRGIAKTELRLVRNEKLKYIVHAEQDAIFAAARIGTGTQDATMYCPWAACFDCAKAIIQAGIKKLVVHQQMMDKTPEDWKETIAEARKILAEAQIEYHVYDGKIGDCQGFFRGQVWEP